MELLLGIQIDEEWCKIGFRQGIRPPYFTGTSAMPMEKQSYDSFCQSVSQKVRSLLSIPDGLRPVTAIGVVVHGTVHDNTVLDSLALPFLVGKSFANDLGRELGLGDIPIGVIGNVAAALLGSHSDFHGPTRSVESAGALEFASSLSKTR